MQPLLTTADGLFRDPLFVAAAAAAGAALIVAAMIGVALFLIIRARARAQAEAFQLEAAEAQARMLELARLQTETAGRISQMGSMLHQQHSELQRAVNERLDAVTHRLGNSLQTSTNATVEKLQDLHSRLAVIDNAQKNISELTSQVTSLQHILSNKQTRGAFGQSQLEALIADVLPKGAYAFQHKLSNGKVPDCAIFMPDNSALVIDAKFPLEAVTALRDAKDETALKQANARVRSDITKHISDISDRYFITGETQDIALMFIPSESVYAELHERFDDVMQRARRARVMIVSPTLMVMAIQVIKQLRKDAQLREAVVKIRDEVGLVFRDVELLAERVAKLKTHFAQTNKDMDDIQTSTGRIVRRAKRIEELEFEDEPSDNSILPDPRKIAAE